MKHSNKEVEIMASSNEKIFSNALMSLQMQLQTLLEDSGGDNVTTLLDNLCQLSGLEQRIILKYFNNVVTKIVTGSLHISDKTDDEKRDFEDGLYNDLVKAFEYKANCQQKKFELLQGGKAFQRKSVVVDIRDFSKNKMQ